MNDNQTIKCDVTKCKHNRDGKDCHLKSITVPCGCTECTCCGDYAEK